jgi:hypothetical protein
MAYYKKYLKYKNKYLELKSQLGGECDHKPDLNDDEPITLDKYKTRVAAQRVTIDDKCYFIDTLYHHIITNRNGIVPHTGLQISASSRQKLINAYNRLHPIQPQPVQPRQLRSVRRSVRDNPELLYIRQLLAGWGYDPDDWIDGILESMIQDHPDFNVVNDEEYLRRLLAGLNEMIEGRNEFIESQSERDEMLAYQHLP